MRNRTANLAFAGTTGLLCLIFALVAVGNGAAAHPTTAGARFGSGLAALAFAITASRALRMGLVVTPVTITIRNFGSTKVLGWAQVSQLTIVDSGNATGRATCVGFVLTSGEVVRAMPTASFNAAKVRAMLATLNHQRPAAPSPS